MKSEDSDIPIFERRSLIPDNEYLVALKDFEVVTKFRRLVAVCQFQVVDGKYLGSYVTRFYTVRSKGGGKKGAVSVARGSLLLHDYARCFGIPSRPDRVPVSKWMSTPVRAKTRTVKSTSQQHKLPDCLWWSTVESLRSD